MIHNSDNNDFRKYGKFFLAFLIPFRVRIIGKSCASKRLVAWTDFWSFNWSFGRIAMPLSRFTCSQIELTFSNVKCAAPSKYNNCPQLLQVFNRIRDDAVVVQEYKSDLQTLIKVVILSYDCCNTCSSTILFPDLVVEKNSMNLPSVFLLLVVKGIES